MPRSVSLPLLLLAAAACATDSTNEDVEPAGVARLTMPIGTPFAVDDTIDPVPYRGTQSQVTRMGDVQIVYTVQRSDADFHGTYTRRAARVDALANSLDPAGVDTDVGMFFETFAARPEGALLFGHDDASYSDAVARRVDPNLGFLDAAPIPVALDAWPQAVSVGATGWLLAMAQDDTVLLQRMGFDGALVGAPIELATSVDLGNVSAAYLGGAHLVAWKDDDEIHATFLDDDANPLQVAPTTIAVNDADLDRVVAGNAGFAVAFTRSSSYELARFFPDRTAAPPISFFVPNIYSNQVAAGPGGFLATWRSGTNIEVRQFTVDGPAVEAPDIGGDIYPHGLGADDTGYLLVDEAFYADDLATRVARLGADGALSTPFLPLGTDADRQGEPALAATATRVLATWSRDGDAGAEPRGRLFDTSGTSVDDTFVLGPARGSHPYSLERRIHEVAASPSGFVVSGLDVDGDRWFNAFDTTGVLIGSSTIAYSATAAMAWDGTQFVVLLDDGDWARLDANATIVGARAPLLSVDTTSGALACDENDCIAVTHDSGGVFVHRFDSITGVAQPEAAVGDVAICTLCDTELTVAAAGGRAVVAWDADDSTQSALEAAVVDLATGAVGPELVVAAAGFGARAAATSGGFVVTFTDPRPAGTNDVYARPITAFGALLPAQVVVSETEIDGTTAVASLGGNELVVAYEKVDPASSSKERTFLQRFDVVFGGSLLGDACASGAACASGFCSDGVCCDAACGGTCAACAASAGAIEDGRCTAVSAGTQCRASAYACDAPEACDGANTVCPPDESLPDLAPCDDGDACTGNGSCDFGTCEPGAPVACPDPGPCATAACDVVDGCVTTPLADGTPCAGGTCAGGVCAPPSATAAATTGASSASNAVGNGSSGAGAGGEDGEGGSAPDDADGGCSCRAAGGDDGSDRAAFVGLAVVAAAWVRRRRVASRVAPRRPGERGDVQR